MGHNNIINLFSKRFINSINGFEFSLSENFYRSINSYTQVYTDNKLYFFEEFTNHGIDHILAVLNSYGQLIPKKTYLEFIDSENCFALILATFLHDIGMHHTFESFKELIEDDTICIRELDDKPWSQLWKEFIEKANKYDSKKRKALFGNENAHITVPDFQSENKLDPIHRKLIGEFIRIHHPRMAHEIAINGLSVKGQQIIVPVTDENYMADLIGLIARSHGTDIRSLYNYIEAKYSRVGSINPLGIHIWYLMGVLRIADYLQFDKNRVQPVPYKMSGFVSPASNMEHIKHLSIEKQYIPKSDPESLMVMASPKDNLVFVELTELLNSIQYELDLTWAILGEKYGMKRSKKPELGLRRIKSNIQDPTYINDEIDFIPERIRFITSPDLLNRLIEPLYGEDVSYAIRELIQNSIDACYMRQRLENDPSYLPKIDCKLNYLDGQIDKFVLEIFDNGIGMNADIVKNYFLKAGATNRRSAEWESQILNEDRSSSIVKSGKFGVGLLSAFLIGDLIFVETKRIGETRGLKFEASLKSENIKILKDDIEFFGTKIRIPINAKALAQFKEKRINNLIEWDKWYTLREPIIKYYSVIGKMSNLGYKEHYPGINEETPNSIEFKIKGYNKIRLLFNSKTPVILKEYNKYNLTCNGLIIPKAPPFSNHVIEQPHVQVFDFDGNLPINLGRNSLDTKFLPFEEQIVDLIYLGLLEEMISIEVPVIIDENKIIRKPIKPHNKRYLNDNFVYSSDFIYSRQGVYLKIKKLIDHLKDRSLFIIGHKKLTNDEALILEIKTNENDLILFEPTPDSFKGKLNMPIKSMEHLDVALYKIRDIALSDELRSREAYNLTKYKKHINPKSNNNKANYYFGNIKEQELPVDKDSGSPKLDFIEIYNNSLQLKDKINNNIQFENFLLDFFEGGNYILPYNLDERVKRFRDLKFLWLKKHNITDYKSIL